MPSIIEGYNYDIFISYRQKDNKGDRWVSEFVEALKTELESTFKEEISVYFDINPHDGLLETHDVDESLKEKLKCLVFIPIISRTYCDPKSFAWEHEFKAFVEQASKDKLGLKIKLPNGNVANRVLPVRIHDLDIADIEECESILGGFLRGIEFIYKEPGVNRPLSSNDREEKNLNNTSYRNQINKVALAVKDIIVGLKASPASIPKEETQLREPSEEVHYEQVFETHQNSFKSVITKLFPVILTTTILMIVAILAYPKIFKRDTLENLRVKGKISVAVMPFQNRTTDSLWEDSQAIIQNILKNKLSNSEELIVRETESIDYLIQSQGLTNNELITSSLARTISKELDANVFLSGSINQVSNKIRLQAELCDSKTGQIVKSFQIDGSSKEDNCIDIGDLLSAEINNFLIVSVLDKEVSRDFQNFSSPISPEAYRKYILGINSHYKLDYPNARKYLSDAIKIDSNFIPANIMLSWVYFNTGVYDQAKKWCIKAYTKKDQMTRYDEAKTNFTYACNFETPREEIKAVRQLLEIDDQVPLSYYDLGYSYSGLNQYDKAIPEFKKALEIYNKWNSKPVWISYYTALGRAYHETGQYKLENKIYKKAEQDFPDNQNLIIKQAILSFTEGDTVAANKYISKYISILKDNSCSEPNMLTSLADIYSEAGILDKAEEYYRQAHALESVNPDRINNLAYFLIDKDRNVREGMELVDKALELSPDNFDYLHTKGWGLNKQGKYKESFEILQKSWDIRREKAVYNHEAFLHLEAAKKAVASQKEQLNV